jgi:hypothetical protein
MRAAAQRSPTLLGPIPIGAPDLLLLLFLLVLPGYALAYTEIDVKNAPLDPIDLGTWDGVSNAVGMSGNACVIATVDNNKNFNQTQYRIQGVTLLPGTVTPDTSFRLYKTTDPTEFVDVVIEWTDTITSVTEVLAPSVDDSLNEGYTAVDCRNGLINGRLTVTALASSLQTQQPSPGTYTAELQLTAEAVQMVGTTDSTILNPTLVIAGTVKIGNIDDIVLNWSGVGDLTYNEPFCVFSNTGTYAITVSTSTLHMGDPQSFALENPLVAGDTVPYSVQVDDNADADASIGTSVLNGQLLGGLAGNPTELDCAAGGDDAAVFIRIQETDLQGLTGGSYSGTLNLTVEPQ